MTKLTTVVTTSLLAVALSGAAFAAENAEGVREHMALTLEKSKAALASATAGNKDECLTNIKSAKQHYKEITGDAAGKPLQDAIKVMKVGQEECEKGETAKASETLKGVVAALEKINAQVQSSN